jgi:hypothetical protein
MHSPNSAIWLNLIWVARNRATKDGETTYMRKNWHPVPTPWLFRSCSILVKMTSFLCLGKFIFSISLFLHCTTPWSGVTMAQVLTVRVLFFMSIVKTRTICFVSEVKGSQVQQVGIPSISLQSQGSTLLWPLGFQFRSLLIFYWILVPIYSHEPKQGQNIPSTSLQSRIQNIVAIRVSVHKPFFLFLHSHSHLLTRAKPRTWRQRQRIWYHLWSRRRFERIER